MLLAAIRDPDPVLYFEHKYLYRRAKGPLPDLTDPASVVPLGRARIARPGTDLTIVAYGAMVAESVTAADRCDDEGLGSVGVIDLRSLVPWDRETVREAVRQTGRCIAVHEASRCRCAAARVPSGLHQPSWWRK